MGELGSFPLKSLRAAREADLFFKPATGGKAGRECRGVVKNVDMPDFGEQRVEAAGVIVGGFVVAWVLRRLIRRAARG